MKTSMDDTVYTDEELVSLSLTNKQFFGLLVARYEHRLRVYIYRLGKLGEEDTDDLLQNVFLAVYENLNSFDADLKFSSWIYRITHNETMAFFRKRRVRPQGHMVDDSEEALKQVAAELDLLSDLEATDDARHLERALGVLAPHYREVLLLHFFEHRTYDEISDILTLPPGTVATRIHRAKAALRQILTTNGFTHG